MSGWAAQRRRREKGAQEGGPGQGLDLGTGREGGKRRGRAASGCWCCSRAGRREDKKREGGQCCIEIFFRVPSLMMLTLAIRKVCSGAKADVALEAQGSEIVHGPHCLREAYASAKHNVKLHPVIGEQTAEKSDFITGSQSYKTEQILNDICSFQSVCLFSVWCTKWWCLVCVALRISSDKLTKIRSYGVT